MSFDRLFEWVVVVLLVVIAAAALGYLVSAGGTIPR